MPEGVRLFFAPLPLTLLVPGPQEGVAPVGLVNPVGGVGWVYPVDPVGDVGCVEEEAMNLPVCKCAPGTPLHAPNCELQMLLDKAAIAIVTDRMCREHPPEKHAKVAKLTNELWHGTRMVDAEQRVSYRRDAKVAYDVIVAELQKLNDLVVSS